METRGFTGSRFNSAECSKTVRGNTGKLAWLAGSAIVLALITVLYLFDPADSHFYPRCYFHAITGLECPGCGSLRALHALLHGQLRNALRLNPLLFAGGLFVLFALAHDKLKKDKPSLLSRPVVLWCVVVGIVLFWVTRNLWFLSK